VAHDNHNVATASDEPPGKDEWPFEAADLLIDLLPLERRLARPAAIERAEVRGTETGPTSFVTVFRHLIRTAVHPRLARFIALIPVLAGVQEVLHHLGARCPAPVIGLLRDERDFEVARRWRGAFVGCRGYLLCAQHVQGEHAKDGDHGA